MEEDIRLVERYIAGDGRSIEEAKDLTQKTFVKAINGIRDFRKEASFKTWLYQIAINTSLNHIRQSRYVDLSLMQLLTRYSIRRLPSLSLFPFCISYIQ
jgi:RNA polymerase sigma factor (sigma-70 family)